MPGRIGRRDTIERCRRGGFDNDVQCLVGEQRTRMKQRLFLFEYSKGAAIGPSELKPPQRRLNRAP